jgi:hypothetical protein
MVIASNLQVMYQDDHEDPEACGQPVERSIWVVDRELDGIRRLFHNYSSFVPSLPASGIISRWDLQ